MKWENIVEYKLYRAIDELSNMAVELIIAHVDLIIHGRLLMELEKEILGN